MGQSLSCSRGDAPSFTLTFPSRCASASLLSHSIFLTAAAAAALGQVRSTIKAPVPVPVQLSLLPPVDGLRIPSSSGCTSYSGRVRRQLLRSCGSFFSGEHLAQQQTGSEATVVAVG